MTATVASVRILILFLFTSATRGFVSSPQNSHHQNRNRNHRRYPHQKDTGSSPSAAASSALLALSTTAGAPRLPLSYCSSRAHRRRRRPNNATPPLSSPCSRRSGSPTTTALRASPSALLLPGLDRAVATASLSATAKLLSSIGLGGLAARKKNVLDAAAVSALSRLTYSVFQPAFLLCSVGQTLYRASSGGGGGLPGRILALMPLAALLQISLGSLSGQVITKFAGMSDDESRDVRMCTAFANSGPLPLIFADALFGKAGAVSSEVVACVSFYLLVWSPLFWSYGRVILGTYGKDADAQASMSAGRRAFERFKEVMSPPVIGSILGVVVGGVPFLQRAMFKGWLKPLFGALNTLGTAYLPAAILVLAGSLVGSGDASKNAETQRSDSNGGGGSAVTSNNESAVNGEIASGGAAPPPSPSLKAIVSIFVARFLMAPLLSLGLLKALLALGLMGPAGTRPRAVVTFVLLMEGCMPPAQNSVIMLQLEGLTARATSMAKLLTLMYALAVIPVTVLLTTCLSASQIMNFL